MSQTFWMNMYFMGPNYIEKTPYAGPVIYQHPNCGSLLEAALVTNEAPWTPRSIDAPTLYLNLWCMLMGGVFSLLTFLNLDTLAFYRLNAVNYPSHSYYLFWTTEAVMAMSLQLSDRHFRAPLMAVIPMTVAVPLLIWTLKFISPYVPSISVLFWQK